MLVRSLFTYISSYIRSCIAIASKLLAIYSYIAIASSYVRSYIAIASYIRSYITIASYVCSYIAILVSYLYMHATIHQ